ncbi:hypothetical protein E1258_27635 [Micromonospora sp. KC207]|uniref:hypothetical protein n=1 Tax=Micromonospora sp. KC207 TaxID=2530377 RepID=UPI001045340A|nr:hypothetical protein [Micromonospora sp. KC207]TDC48848.1 hypothetical protein E1258_27635 [Micromonospora sp. KC207]
MTALKTRQPTGRVPWPLILIEGGEKAGKSWLIAELSASPKVGQTYWIDLGEGAGDEYGAIPGARYLMIEHDGTFADILGQVEAAKAEAARVAAAKLPPVVLGIDSATLEWDLLKGIADAKARARLAKRGKQIAPDAEPQISMDLWNEINAKHRRLMTHLMTFPGIVVVTARGKEVAALDSGGRPVEGSKEYKVEGQKNLAFDATVWVRVSRDHPPMVIGARSVHAGIRPGVDRPRPVPGLTLEKLVFDILKCNPDTAHVRDLVPLSTADDSTGQDEPARPVSGPPAARPVSGPPAALSAAATGLLDDLRQATDETGLRRVWKAAADAAKAARISAPEVTHFQATWKARKAELFPPEPKNPGNDPARRRMFALLGQADITDRDDRLAYVSDIAGRAVASTNDLTATEVSQVIERVESYIAQQTPQQMEMAG